MVVEISHPVLGTLRTLGNPIKLSRSPVRIGRPPPGLGEHTDEVLGVLKNADQQDTKPV